MSSIVLFILSCQYFNVPITLIIAEHTSSDEHLQSFVTSFDKLLKDEDILAIWVLSEEETPLI